MIIMFLIVFIESFSLQQLGRGYLGIRTCNFCLCFAPCKGIQEKILLVKSGILVLKCGIQLKESESKVR